MKNKTGETNICFYDNSKGWTLDYIPLILRHKGVEEKGSERRVIHY